MVYAIKLGPIETEEGRFEAYFGFGKTGLLPPIFSTRDADALLELARGAAGEELCCEPRLARAGRALGFVAGPMTPQIAEARAELALLLGLGGVLGPGAAEGLQPFLQAAAAFWSAQPWRHWHDGQPIEVRVEGALEHRFEGCVMGHGGMEFGLALYRDPGALSRLATHMKAGRAGSPPRMDAIAVTYDDEPRFAAQVLKQAHRLQRVPRPMSVRAGVSGGISALELAVLAGAMGAVAQLTPRVREVEGECGAGATRLHVSVSAPAPDGPARRARLKAASRPAARSPRRSAATAAVTTREIFQLKVTLKHISPPIWRRLLVPGDIKLGMLHSVIQVALGWTNSHLHHFVVGKTLIGMADVDSYAPTIDEEKIRLDEIAMAKTRFMYEYDFGDSWRHEVVVEKILPAEPGTTYPRCVAGERACPPEDCGGAGGYEHLLEVIADREHEEHDELMEWLGGSFDPEAFDLAAVNGARRSSRRRASHPRV